MANKEQVKILKQDVKAWNIWRANNPAIRVDLSEADLKGADLVDANLRYADLSGASLSGADLTNATLFNTSCVGTNMSYAILKNANLSFSIAISSELYKTNLIRADLSCASLANANLRNAIMTDAILMETVFADANIADVIGLETCKHHGPSVIDFRALQKSGRLPIEFLRGVGLPENLIDYLPSLMNQPIQYYSCFISYSAKDQEFAERLHADLQNKGVRCWFAPHDMPIGGRLRDEIETAIRMRDKVLLILSEHSIESGWVENEVETAIEEEKRRDQTVLFPLRLDDMVMETSEAWAATLRRQRHIGDFTRWKDHDAYKKSFERVLRDLKANKKPGG